MTDLPDILICGLDEARLCWHEFEAVISIENQGTIDVLRMTDAQARSHLVLTFSDVDFNDNDPDAPARAHLDAAIAFARRHRGRRLLIHCHAGRYRSAAIGLAVLADIYGHGREPDAVAALLAIRPVAAPNLIALAHADAALGRNGTLHAAWMAREATDPDYGQRRHRRYLWENSSQRSALAQQRWDGKLPNLEIPGAAPAASGDDGVDGTDLAHPLEHPGSRI
jgi:predicted protein tyrosine phosphatase